ncbi:tripartite tricarboxylate transporter substrate binding protein [Phytoactinopolyspora endophytica]|uniref:tripartite tricarboxylate transporter substrate binding protein n=1 Tax=Phytoactinopolyspora endophytica TaxID=1642495 RepID=UPI00101C285F|nr:tripartite tricarboxylate transporter substrate binding protein [Phytoactinopolyspora endophytica]
MIDRRTTASLLALAATGLLVLSGCSGNAQGGEGDGGSPGRNITMIVPFSAGGGSDLAGRAIAQGLEDVTGSTVTVENIVGGSGAVGYSDLLAKEGDGTTLLASETALMTLPVVQDVQFSHESFTPIMKVGEDYNIVVVAADASYETCMDVVDAAAESSLTAAVSGATGPDHIAWSLIEDQHDISLERVTFESSAEVTAALLGGHIDVAATSPGEIVGQLESGDVKPLCALAPERYEYELLADVPTGAEQGIDVTFAQWRGFIAAGGVSEEHEQYWIDAAREYAETDAYETYIEDNMLQPQVLYGDEFRRYLDEYRQQVEAVLGDE